MLAISRSMLTLSRMRNAVPALPHRLEFSSLRVAGSLLGLASFAVFGVAALVAPSGIALPFGFAALVYGVGSSAAVFGRKDGVELGAVGAVGIGLSVWVLGGLAMIEAEFWHPGLFFILVLTVSVLLHLRVLVPGWRARTVQVVLRRAFRTVDPGGRAGSTEIVGVICLVAFGYSMYRARHTRIGWDVPIGGYLGRIGAAWYAALAVMIAALAFYAWRKKAGGVLFAGLQLVVAIFSVPILTYSVPRSPSAQKHMDIIEYLIQHRQVTGIAGIYADWNGFFSGVAAALDGSGDSGDRLRLETFWPLLMALATFAVVTAMVRILGYDRLTGYLVGTVATVANVLQQDYFSPQSVGYVMGLCLFAVVLSKPRMADPLVAPGVVPARRHPGFEIRWWQIWYALIFGVVIGVSHQFTPFAVAGAIGVLVLWGAIRPFKRGVVLAVAVTAPIVVWALIHFDIIADFLNPAQLGNASNFSTPQTLSAPGIARLPIVAQSSLTLLATLLLVGVIAIVGSVRFVRNRVTLALGSAAVFAFSLILITPYGNEGIFRASLFALPWLIMLGLPAYRALAHGRWLMSLVLAAVLVLLTGFYLVSSAGLDASNVARRADAAAYVRVTKIARHHPNTVYAVLQMGPGDLPTNLPVVPTNLHYLQPTEEIPSLGTVNKAQTYLHFKFVRAYKLLHQIRFLQKGQKFVEFVLYSPASAAYAREYGQARLPELLNLRRALYIDPEQSVISVKDDTVLAQVRKGEWLRRS